MISYLSRQSYYSSTPPTITFYSTLSLNTAYKTPSSTILSYSILAIAMNHTMFIKYSLSSDSISIGSYYLTSLQHPKLQIPSFLYIITFLYIINTFKFLDYNPIKSSIKNNTSGFEKFVLISVNYSIVLKFIFEIAYNTV